MHLNVGLLDELPRVELAHVPTPIDQMPNLSRVCGNARLFVKRDDCTGLGLGGNKARQLEFYLGEALKQKADSIVITGAVQSNYVRAAAAAARKCGLDIHIQLEKRVASDSRIYYRSGNVLLSRLYGAKLYSFPMGEDEAGADRNLETIADGLRSKGQTPYVVHLGSGHPPLGALGYVMAARELLEGMNETRLQFDEIIVGSGSGATHAGLLFGLRALGSNIPVFGICVRRDKTIQQERIVGHCEKLAILLGVDNPVDNNDIQTNDDALAPGYGTMNDQVANAMTLAAREEGLILDPVYTGRAMAGFLDRAKVAREGQNLLFIHTGGQPAVFGYEDMLEPLLSEALA